MAIVAGVDFGTLSVRVTLLDSVRGRLGTASAEYPLARRRDDPDYATQSHDDQMRALVRATRLVLEENPVNGQDVAAIALDEVPGGFPAHQHCTRNVRGKDSIKAGLIHIHQLLENARPGIVNENVEVSEG